MHNYLLNLGTVTDIASVIFAIQFIFSRYIVFTIGHWYHIGIVTYFMSTGTDLYRGMYLSVVIDILMLGILIRTLLYKTLPKGLT